MINFALTREQSFQLLWAKGKGDAPKTHSQREPEMISQFNLADAAGLPLEPSLSAIASPQETAVLYSTMRVRAANHNQPVGTVNHTSWVVSDPSRQPLLALDREEWADAIKQPTAAQTLKVPWFRQAGKGRWAELVLNNFDDKGHPFHLVSEGSSLRGTGVAQSLTHHTARVQLLRCRDALRCVGPVQRVQPIRPGRCPEANHKHGYSVAQRHRLRSADGLRDTALCTG